MEYVLNVLMVPIGMEIDVRMVIMGVHKVIDGMNIRRNVCINITAKQMNIGMGSNVDVSWVHF